MTTKNWASWVALGISAALVSLLGGKTLQSQSTPKPMPIVGTNPQAGTLNATLWMRTSGEYRALCLQTYRLATESLKRLHAIAPTEVDRVGKKLAVVLDLDETVFDNSLFQSGVILRSERFSDEAFNRWIDEHRDDVALVPGSKGFIGAAESLGLRIYYITNRPESARSATVATLQRLGVAAGDDVSGRLLMRADTSLKDARRSEVTASNFVLMLVGDNLADFSDEFNPKNFAKAADPIAGRLNAVEGRAQKWGAEWIVLPNPVYGDWTKPIEWKDPAGALLRPSDLNQK